MSLVERVAKRLGELGKPDSLATGDPSSARSRSDAAGSLIEQTLRKVEALEGRRAEPSGTRGRETRNSEPSVGGATTPAATAVREPLRSPDVPPTSPKVELDFAKLGSAGYLQPDDPESVIGNEFRKIKRPLIQACQGKLATPIANANRIMVTSSVPGEGKSFISLNLALSIAMERDSTVLLIDADTTRRNLSRLIGLGSNRGLLDLLSGQVEVSEVLLRTNLERLSVLPAGAQRRHATEMLASETMEQLVDQLASRYPDRLLIFDTPPLLGAPEPAVLASHMGQIIVVVEADSTTRKVLTNALATIQSCPLVTTILNKTSSGEAGYYYYAA